MTISDPQKTILAALAVEPLTRGVIANRYTLTHRGTEAAHRSIAA